MKFFRLNLVLLMAITVLLGCNGDKDTKAADSNKAAIYELERQLEEAKRQLSEDPQSEELRRQLAEAQKALQEATQSQNQDEDSEEHWISSIAFQRIEAGSFTMWSPPSERRRGSDEGQEEVEITKPFEIMKTEVTQKQWFRVMKENPSYSKRSVHCGDHEIIDGVGMCPNHPVEKVSWDDVQKYIEELNKSLGLTGCDGTPHSSSGCYRLPTEAEWEWAARAGTKTAYFFGDDSSDLGDYAWYLDNSVDRTHKVGLKDSNPWGLYDIYGNVWEWVQDKYSEELPGGIDPLNEDGVDPVLRGGDWLTDAFFLRSADRYGRHPGYRDNGIGFRLVRTL